MMPCARLSLNETASSNEYVDGGSQDGYDADSSEMMQPAATAHL